MSEKKKKKKLGIVVSLTIKIAERWFIELSLFFFCFQYTIIEPYDIFILCRLWIRLED